MTDLEFQRELLDVVNTALELNDEQREAYVVARCGGKEPLLTEVRRMLQIDADPKVLPTSALPHNAIAEVPERVGPYLITGILGYGGMGAVYKAERADGNFDRTVAIKFINTGFLSSELLARFENEKRITAKLEHPNIARLIDGGEVSNRPYIVMEYAEGAPFTYDADRSRKDVLSIFCEVCEALEYAHNNLVLHRDIKPGNILISADGKPKLLDFGVAKLQEDLIGEEDGITRGGQLPMTPAYTSPECLAGYSATVRSEVYSLGVLLYELLQGDLPFDLTGMNLVQAHETVTRGSSNKIETNDEDLNVIIATAMHVDPARRYPSPAAMAEDIRAALNNRPIAARYDDRAYIVKRFVSRHKGAVVSTLTGACAVVVALAMATFSYLEAESARGEAQIQADTAQAAVGFLGGVLEGANPYLNPSNNIDDALKRAENKLLEMHDDPYLEAYVRSNLANIHGARGNTDEAMNHARKAEQLTIGLDKVVPAWWSIYWANAANSATEYDQALVWSEQALIASKNSPNLSEDDKLKILLVYAKTLTNMGNFEEAERELADIVERFSRHENLDPDTLAAAHFGLSQVEYFAGNYAKSLQHNDRAIDIYEKLGPPGRAEVFHLGANRVHLLAALGRWEETESEWLANIAGLRSVLGEAHSTVAMEVGNLGAFYERRDMRPRGIAFMEKQLAVMIREDGSYPVDNGISHLIAKLGYSQCGEARYEEGLAHLRLALDQLESIFPSGHWRIGDVRGAMGFCLTGLGRYEQAEAELDLTYQIYKEAFSPDHPNIASIERWYAALYEKTGEFEKAARFKTQ